MRRISLKIRLAFAATLAIITIIFIFANYGRQFLVAQEEPAAPEIKLPEERLKPPEEPAIEYVSNEILIKLKPEAHKKLEALAGTYDTGLASLDKLNKEEKVAKFERIAKPTPKNTKSLDGIKLLYLKQKRLLKRASNKTQEGFSQY